MPAATALGDDERAQLIHQDDTFFAAPHGRLKLRVFGDGSGELIAYQRADAEGPKRSDYLIAPVAEPRVVWRVGLLRQGLGQTSASRCT